MIFVVFVAQGPEASAPTRQPRNGMADAAAFFAAALSTAATVKARISSTGGSPQAALRNSLVAPSFSMKGQAQMQAQLQALVLSDQRRAYGVPGSSGSSVVTDAGRSLAGSATAGSATAGVAGAGPAHGPPAGLTPLEVPRTEAVQSIKSPFAAYAAAVAAVIAVGVRC